MELKFTNEAINRLSDQVEGKNGVFRLDYDAEGCGCVNDGVVHLVFVPAPLKGDEEITSNYSNCYIPTQYKIYFDEQLTIDYSSTYKILQLKSSVRMVNPRMTFRVVN